MFYNNFKLYQDLYSSLQKNNINLERICITKLNNTIISSHISIVKLDNRLSELLKIHFKQDIKGDYFFNLGYFNCRDTYIYMSSILLYFLYKKSARNIICLIRSEWLDFLESLPYKQLGTVYIDNNIKLYLVEADFLAIISTPFVMKNFLNVISNQPIEKMFET